MDEQASQSRKSLILAAPFLLMLGASLLSWFWRALELPGVVGNLAPPSLLLMALVIYGGVRAMGMRLPMGLITWPPAALGAVFFLTVGFAASSLDPAAAPSVLFGYLAIFAFVWLISLALADQGVPYAIAFTCMFLLTQVVQIPVLEVEPPVPLERASLFSAAAAGRALLEVGIMVWLTRRLVLGPEGSQTATALALVLLALAHGPLWAWELPLRQGEPLTASAYGRGVTAWVVFTSLQLGVVLVTSRLRRGWSQSAKEDQLEAAPAAESASVPDVLTQEAGREPRRPTPRIRRRR
jgi:hypothetical protein